MNTTQQQNILNALANDLSLTKKLTEGTFKMTKANFSKENQPIFEGLLQLKESGFNRLNTDSFTLLNLSFTVIPLEKAESRTTLKNILYSFEQQQATLEIEKTKRMIEQKAKELVTVSDVLTKERIIKEIEKLASKHKVIVNKNNAKSALEITQGLKFDDRAKPIPTYIEGLDALINGGYEKYNIAIISAAPHHGKTTLAVGSATAQAMNNYRVLYLSLEQTKENINQGVLAYVGEEKRDKDGNFTTKYDKVYFDHTKFADQKDAEEKKKIGIEFLRNSVLDFLKIEDTEFNGVDEILARINLAADEGYDIVYIDNFQNLKYTGNRTEAFEKFSEGLLEIAKSTGLAIVALSQLTEDKNGNQKTMYARKLNMDASNHIRVTRLEKDKDAPSTPDQIEIYVEKARRGADFNATLTLPFIGSKGIIGKAYRPNRSKEENNKRINDYAGRNLVGGFFDEKGVL